MNYRGKKVAITGFTGFIGSALKKRLVSLGAVVIELEGDVRDPKTFDILDHSFSYLFHFGAPSSQVLFKDKPLYCADVTVNGFINAAKAARTNGVKLVYPSTGILSFDRTNEYARCKKICEDIHLGENLDALGLRIFMGYGPGEGHKAHWASPAYLFARDIVEGKKPVIWGDGTQTRDLIYIDDLVKAITVLAEEQTSPIVDVGSGEPISFNEILDHIWNVIPSKRNLAEYRRDLKPKGYVQDTVADPSELISYNIPLTPFSEGIKNIIKSLKDSK